MKLRTWEVTEDVLFLFSHQSCLTLQPHELQHSRLVQIHPFNPWCLPTVIYSATPSSSCSQSFPESGSVPMSWLFASGSQSIVFQLQHRSSNELVWSPCCPRDSQESSPTAQLESINSSALSLLYDSTLTSIHDYWENHSFDYMEVFQKSDACAF